MSVYVPLNGSKRELLPNSHAAGALDLSEIVSLTIRVRSVGDPATLVELARELGRTPVAERRYLTHAELADQHGAAEADLDAVVGFAGRHKLTVVRRSAVERSVVVKGQLRDLLAAFPAEVGMYHHSTGTYRGRRGEIAIPQEIGHIVTGVFGFDTRLRHRTRYAQDRVRGPGGHNGVVATEFATRYKFPSDHDGTKLDGTGQTIALIELGGGYRPADLEAFFAAAGIAMPNVTAVSVDHGDNQPTNANSADAEVMMDIEVAGAVAPHAAIAVYFGPNSDQGFLDAISAAVHDTQRKPGAISISWGAPEAATDQQGIQAFHEVFAAAASLGITVCTASGDHGCADRAAGDWDGKVHVDHPACDEFALGCGGTQIEAGVDVVWNDGTSFDAADGGGGWASGGGISQVFAVPSYQQGVQLPTPLQGGKAGRGVPDIAMSATNYYMRVDGLEGAAGGTSAVAPLMAGLVARLNQARKKNVGFINPLLYQNPDMLTDVTKGSNAIAKGPPGYDAATGWDPCTGLGTPDGTAMLKKL
ncbi:MAG TPA: S53 family serine peptidase [Kofleriaceae bacterium]|jgi:kumamolisin|nr:S53 family serine peptidase [Kofleriaceae bacterium]